MPFLVLACNDYLCIMKLGQDTSRGGSLTETHRAPVSCAVYNPKLKQVIISFSFIKIFFIIFIKVNNMCR